MRPEVLVKLAGRATDPRPPKFHTVDQAQSLAKRRLPASVYRYIEGGTDAERTVRDNRRAFEEVTFRPRAAVFTGPASLATTVCGSDLAFPVVVAPAGFIRLAHRDAEIGAARAAGAVGTAIGISTLSSHDIVDIAAAAPGPVWYQVYFAGGRAAAEVAIDRARDAGCAGLIVTVDLAASAARERLMRGGVVPTRITPRNALTYAPEMVRRPRWLVDFVRDGMALTVPNVRATHDGAPLSVGAASRSMRDSAPTWGDLGWIRERFGGPVIVKGILDADDARRAVDGGAAGVVVSNHGGNALDGTPATLRVLPEIAEAVGGDLDVLVDGGIRRGSDVVRALALGARAVLIGRSYVWALAAAGGPGVQRVLELFRDDIARTLGLLGCPSVGELDRSYVDAPWAPTVPRSEVRLGRDDERAAEAGGH